MTVLPCWLTQLQARVTRRCTGSLSVTVTRTVRRSPTRTGAWNFSVWPRYTVPGPGRRVPSTAEMSAAPHMPWAMTPWNWVEAAYSASRCAGFTSPDITANSWMSSALSWRSI